MGMFKWLRKLLGILGLSPRLRSGQVKTAIKETESQIYDDY